MSPFLSPLSRFENLATPQVLQKLIDFTINTGIERLKQKHGGTLPASITLDLDATDDPTHGHQQLTLFHGYYGQYQYFPLIISEPTTKHVFVAWLRPGTVHASLEEDKGTLTIMTCLPFPGPAEHTLRPQLDQHHPMRRNRHFELIIKLPQIFLPPKIAHHQRPAELQIAPFN